MRWQFVNEDYNKGVSSLKEKFKLGLIQMITSRDKSIAVGKAIENISQLADNGANLVVLPEMFNCPYETQRFPSYAEPEGGETWQKMQQIAIEKKIYLVAGSIPEIEAGKIYNTSFVFDPNGNQIGKHRKIHMFDINIENGQYFKESETLEAGNQPTVFETEYGKIGLAICYDIRFPELARLMVAEGAKMIIYPAAFNMTTGPAHWELLFRSRAVDNQVFTVGCAPARDYSLGYISYGNSIVVDPWGDVLGRLDDTEGYLLGEIDFNEVRQIREQLPIIRQLRNDVYSTKLK